MESQYVGRLYFGERAAMMRALAENEELHRQVDYLSRQLDHAKKYTQSNPADTLTITKLQSELKAADDRARLFESLYQGTRGELNVYIEMQERLNRNLAALPDLAELIEMYQTTDLD